MKHNINIIDDCLSLHNLISDFQEAHEGKKPAISVIDRDVFDKDCQGFLEGQANLDRLVFMEANLMLAGMPMVGKV